MLKDPYTSLQPLLEVLGNPIGIRTQQKTLLAMSPGDPDGTYTRFQLFTAQPWSKSSLILKGPYTPSQPKFTSYCWHRDPEKDTHIYVLREPQKLQSHLHSKRAVQFIQRPGKKQGIHASRAGSRIFNLGYEN